MTDLKKVMQNVMAVLNSYGVVYSPFEHSDCVFGLPKDFLLVRESEFIDYDDKTFPERFQQFATENPDYLRIFGVNWADDDDAVIIQLARQYEMTEKDWEEYLSQCGCSDPMVACTRYGFPPKYKKYRYLNVRVKKSRLSYFVGGYAHFFWES